MIRIKNRLEEIEVYEFRVMVGLEDRRCFLKWKWLCVCYDWEMIQTGLSHDAICVPKGM